MLFTLSEKKTIIRLSKKLKITRYGRFYISSPFPLKVKCHNYYVKSIFSTFEQAPQCVNVPKKNKNKVVIQADQKDSI